MKLKSCFALAGAGCLAVSSMAVANDVVIEWNSAYLQSIREFPTGPGDIARNGAMLHAAVFNAVNALDQTHVAYGGFNFVPDPGASKKAAATEAAYQVLTALYPARAAEFAALRTTTQSGIGAAELNAGRAIGLAAANHIIALRSGDGHDGDPSYTPGPNPGDWQPTQPGDPVHPQWGNVTPWGMTNGAQFRPDRLTNYGSMANFLASQEYADNVNEVKQLGRIDSWTPADEEYQIAFFWANDRNGTYKPPGHLNEITHTIANRQFAGMNEDDRISVSARLFALANAAMADAGVAAWDCKYNTGFDLWRPITAIQNAHLDGNPMTDQDAFWEPLNNVDPDGPGPMLPDPFSPQFPAYVSGHATFGAAHAKIMELFFGGDEIVGGPLEIGTDDPYVPGLTRTFANWSDMALENGRSRVYLGVHYQFDADDGYTMGSGLAEWMFNKYFVEIPSPGPIALLSIAGVLVFRRRR